MSQPLADTAIEVTADTEPFEDDVDRLAKKTRRRKIEAPVGADTRQMLRQIDRALESLRGAEVQVDAGTAGLIAELERALDGFTGDIDVDADVARLVAEVDRALAGIELVVPVKPEVRTPERDANGRFKKVGAELGNDAADAFDRAFGPKVLNAVKRIGSGIAKVGAPIGKTFLGAAAGAVALGGALQTVSSLAAALGPVFAAGLAFLPGFLLARAVAVGAFKLAVVGLSDALSAAAEGDAAAFEAALEKLSPQAREFATAARDALDALRPLQQSLQDATFANLADDVARVGRDLQSLRPYLDGVGQGFNGVIREALGLAASDDVIGALQDTLTGVRQILLDITPAITPIGRALAGLAGEASAFAPAIGAGLADLGTRFAAFIDGVDLAALFEAALPTLRVLGQLFTNIGTIASSVFAASGASGAGLLGVLADLTGTLGAFLSSAEGLAALRGLFAAVGQVGEAFGTVLQAILPPLATALQAITPAIGPLAQALAGVLVAVAPLLGPLGQLVAIIGGALVQAIVPLIPVISQLAGLLGGVLTALAPTLAQLGSTIGAILAPAAALLAELFRQLAPVIVEVVAAIGPLLAPLLKALGPLFTQLLGSLLPLIPALVGLIPPLLQIVVALSPLIELAAQLLTALVAVVAPILQLAAAFTALLVAKVIAPLITLIANAITYLLQPVTAAAAKVAEFTAMLGSINWAGIGAAISGAFTAAWQAVVSAVEGIVAFVTSLPGRIGAVLAAIPGIVVGLFQRMGQLALQAIGVAIGLVLYNFLVLPGKIGSAIASIPGILRNLFTRAVNGARSAAVAGFNATVSFISGLPGRVGSALSRLGGIISNAWSRAVTSGRNAAVRGFNSIVSYVQSVPGKIAGLAGRFVAAGSRIVRGLVDGLKRVPSLGSIGSAIAGVIRRQANGIIGAINRGISQVDSLLPGSLPRIPTFARGAVVDQATLGVFGEAGREVIIPLERPQRARELAQESGLDRILANGGDAAPVYVSMRAYIGSTEITRMITFEVDRVLDDTAAQVDAGVRAF